MNVSNLTQPCPVPDPFPPSARLFLLAQLSTRRGAIRDVRCRPVGAAILTKGTGMKKITVRKAGKVRLTVPVQGTCVEN